MRLVRAGELIGLPVVSTDAGEDLAEVRDVVYDGETHSLLGFTVNRRGFRGHRSNLVLPIDSVRAVGPDAVMVGAPAAFVEPEAAEPDDDGRPDAADVRKLTAARPVTGNRVLSESGKDLGEVISVIIDVDGRPEAVGYEIKTRDGSARFVPITAQVALSGDNLLLRDDAPDRMHSDLDDFTRSLGTNRAPDDE